jgi:hypothetical protein
MDSKTYQALRSRFQDNRSRIPEEYLAPYRGKWVAWWPDGSRIVDADVSLRALDQRLEDAGHRVSLFPLEQLALDPNAPIDPYTALCMRFAENRNNFPGEQLEPYGGKWVAWWPDGSRIVDADDDFDALWSRLRNGGYNVYQLKLEHLPFPGESFV